MAELRKVRVSQNPTQEIEVSEAEYVDLVHQGLVVNAKGDRVTKVEPAKPVKAESAEPVKATPAEKKKES